jgi:hypothetical protein
MENQKQALPDLHLFVLTRPQIHILFSSIEQKNIKNSDS